MLNRANNRKTSRTALLIGASLLGMCVSQSAFAQTLAAMRAASGGGSTPTAGSTGAPVSAHPLSAVQASANLRAMARAAEASSRVDLAAAAQVAARASASGGTVANGLLPGGLVPSVTAPTLAINDPTGKATWEGATMPGQTVGADGKVQVTIDQTQSRAILTWNSFNVGANTTLTFNQKVGGVAQKDWVALNRVVDAVDPSQILGTIKADGTVLILNKAGVMFGAGSTVNTHSLLVSSLDLGNSVTLDNVPRVRSLYDRNMTFLANGLLGERDGASTDEQARLYTFAPVLNADGSNAAVEGHIRIEQGASITSGEAGYIIALAPGIYNYGALTSPSGQVSLHSGRRFFFDRSEGAGDSLNPFIRGLVISSQTLGAVDPADFVVNGANGILSARRGYVSLAATGIGAVQQDGIIVSTTGVSRNGYVGIYGGDIRLGTGSLIHVAPEAVAETIPQSDTGFKTTQVDIGSSNSRIEIAGGSMILAPSADLFIGADSGEKAIVVDEVGAVRSRIFVDSNAVIDVSGMKNVVVPTSRYMVTIDPVKGNELRDTPLYRATFLNGETVIVDARLSGVREDGVAWVGSPLIEAGSFYAQVGVTASELMTSGGNISMGVAHYEGVNNALAPDIIIKAGAIVDFSGGWLQYEAGTVNTTQLVTSSGQIVDIGAADPNGDYVGIAKSYTETLGRTDISVEYGNPVLSGARSEPAYIEGRDAGSLTLKGAAIALDGTLDGRAFAGMRQLLDASIGTGSSGIYGDQRAMQAAGSQLPSGGYLNIQAISKDAGAANSLATGASIRIADAGTFGLVASDLGFGQSFAIGDDGVVLTPARDAASYLTAERRDEILLSDTLLNDAGLGQINLQTSGAITLDSGAALALADGGIVTALAGRQILLNGSIHAAGGSLAFVTENILEGSRFADDAIGAGSLDIIVNGRLSTRGRWTNDFGNTGQLQGASFIDGGSLYFKTAPRVAIAIPDNSSTSLDVSGSILINDGALLDVSGGGYVGITGKIDQSAKGGNVSLINQTNYFQLQTSDDAANLSVDGNIPGFRFTRLDTGGAAYPVAVNPAQINARISIADNSILAHGFAGGGTFNLTTPAISFGNAPVVTGTALPLDFFSETGFANYNITSYATDLSANNFNNSLGGYNAVLKTQTLTIGAGEVLNLTQSRFAPYLSTSEVNGLLGLASGGDLYSVLTPAVMPDAYDRLGVKLSLGGLVELHVAEGGRIEGDAYSAITASKFWNEGHVRMIGGRIVQTEDLLSLYAGNDVYAAHSLADLFTVSAGAVQLGAASKVAGLTNAALAAKPIYLLGALERTDGIVLSAGSVTDLSGASLRNPRALQLLDGTQLVQGRMIDGGSITTSAGRNSVGRLLDRPELGRGIYQDERLNLLGTRIGRQMNADAGAVIDLSGASDSYDMLSTTGRYVARSVWSEGGDLTVNAGGSIEGALIDAHGGSLQAQGGTLTWLDPVLVETGAAAINELSATQIEDSGFDNFVALRSLTGRGDVSLALTRSFILKSQPYDGLDSGLENKFVLTVASTGRMEIDAAYIGFDSLSQEMASPLVGTVGTGSVRFGAKAMDFRGATLFDRSIASVELESAGNIRLIGALPTSLALGLNNDVESSLKGQLVANGNISLTAGQVYPTTGSTFLLSSTFADGVISFLKTPGSNSTTPYSAGSNLLVQAATIVQGGVLRAPLGTLTLGGTAALAGGFAPATRSVTLLDGSITSVSANGLSIPYGTTTDQIEYYFTPTSADPLTAPPTGLLTLTGDSIATNAGAVVDISGGGDVYAYEFVPGTGGSRDVLDRFNNDPFSSNDGYQYADARQVYAIVPGLSSDGAAAYDPIYSSDYASLYAGSDVGKQVWLDNVPGLAAGWYTLLPAKYALLPGGMRIVEQTGADTLVDAAGGLRDGTTLATGYYGYAGTDLRESTLRTFAVQSQDVFRKYSNIITTSANTVFTERALRNGVAVPRLPLDAGRLVLAPINQLLLDARIASDAAEGGRGGAVDISGLAFRIVDDAAAATPDAGTIILSAGSLTGLGVESLFIGGTRRENADGTTSLAIAAKSISIENSAAHALSAPELLFATDGSGSTLTVADGAVIRASGTIADPLSTDYVIDGAAAGMTGEGALLRVANGAERLVRRTNMDSVAVQPVISVGAATLDGRSIYVGSSGDTLIKTGAVLTDTDSDGDGLASAIALEAGQVNFSDNGALSGLVLTAALRDNLSAADRLTIRSGGALLFDDGDYSFGNIVLDGAGLGALTTGGTVNINADALRLSNSVGLSDICAGGLACGAGTLNITADSLSFGQGVIKTYGFGQSATINAAGGISYDGVGGFDAGSAALTLNTPFIADAAVTLLPGVAAVLPSLSLITSGAVSINGSGMTAAALPAGTPGAKLTVRGETVDVRASHLRATAGTLDVQANGLIAVSDGAILDAPSYARVFGDDGDSYSVSAPGGRVKLTSTGGDIDLGEGTLLSVGGESGKAGTLALSAANGTIAMNGAIDGNAPAGGGSLLVDTGGAFDFDGFASDQKGFTGTIDIRTGTGDLMLGAGKTLLAQNLLLASENGAVDIAGAIDASGINGGDVSLYGRNGVTLRATASIDATADGYANLDARQATGGDVLIGTDEGGAILVESGAAINVAALRPGNRLVPIQRNGVTYYDYAESDLGGTVTFRAPVLGDYRRADVAVDFAGTVTGAREVAVEAFKRWDLAAIAADSRYTGVTIVDGTAVLDTGAYAAGKVNFLSGADYVSGASASYLTAQDTLVDFINGFDISNAYVHLGGLGDDAVFVARPGVELVHDGDIKLNSNWNFAAAQVDTAGAVSAGVMRNSTATGVAKLVVNAGREAELLQNHASFLYRVGGDVAGAAGSLVLRAGGDLNINGTVTDGMFVFGDQTDPDYLRTVVGVRASTVTRPVLPITCFLNNCSTNIDFTSTIVPNLTTKRATVSFNTRTNVTVSSTPAVAAKAIPDDIPFSIVGNSAAALGSGTGGAGDPMGSAELFPQLSDGSYVSSWSYGLVGGAAKTDGAWSVDSMRIAALSQAGVSITGSHSYSYGGSSTSSAGGLALRDAGSVIWELNDLVAPTVNTRRPDANDFTTIDLNDKTAAVKNFLIERARAFFINNPARAGQYSSTSSGGNLATISTNGQLAEDFLVSLLTDDANGININDLLVTSGGTPATQVSIRSLVRTGNGTIRFAAAGDVDLTNGAVTTTRLNTVNYQNGGTAVYTVGQRADTGVRSATDMATGQTMLVDPSAYLAAGVTADEFANYRYGSTTAEAKYAGILLIDPVYAARGGDIAVTAGGSILGRRDAYQEARVKDNAYSFMGQSDQPWRIGSIGAVVNLQINPQLFSSGIGALAGGSVDLDAGGDVSDLTLAVLNSATTGDVRTLGGETTTKALVSYGSGMIEAAIEGNLLGGRFDLASGTGKLAVAGSVLTAGTINSPLDVLTENLLRLRVSDAAIDLDVGGTVLLQGIAALGASKFVSSINTEANLNTDGFYSPNSAIGITANGSVSILDQGISVTTQRSGQPVAAVYPASVNLASLTGDLMLNAVNAEAASPLPQAAIMTSLYPSATGQLRLFAGGDISPVSLVMEDRDPGLLPGYFSIYDLNNEATALLNGQDFNFPSIMPNSSTTDRAQLHNSALTHAGDAEPVRIHAGGDISNMILSLPKQARIGAGQDIVNMMLFAQNLTAQDVTRVTAGRDITATTELVTPRVPVLSGEPLPMLQGNTFVISGPGAFFLEAGRDAGPFLNSATVNSYDPTNISRVLGSLSYGGGILSIGNEWNPFLPDEGADINVLFGVAKGADYHGLRDYYLDPANLANLDDDLFVQVTDATGNKVADRSQPIYGALLIDWMQDNYALADGATFQQAYDAFVALPELNQRSFLIQNVYFNELEMTSRPDGPSYLQYSRGYEAVNRLFSADLGYSDNLDGGELGSDILVQTGNLDLRLATVQTARGGDIALLGPGGRILAGSTVRTSEQAARRGYDDSLWLGSQEIVSAVFGPKRINAIPTGYEGILTLRGGAIRSFTDGDLLLNQSRLFSQSGGDLSLWSSNGNLNAGQGPKSAASFPPVVVRIDENGYSEIDAAGGVSGAGIAAFQPALGVEAPSVFLIAPVGTVDAGDAGVRVAGNLFVAAAKVANADNFKVGGASIGVVSAVKVDSGATNAAGSAAAAATKAATAATSTGKEQRSQIYVDVQGYAGGDRCAVDPRPEDCD